MELEIEDIVQYIETVITDTIDTADEILENLLTDTDFII